MFLYDNLPIYILIGLILITVSIFVYIKLAFPFWNIQPVYHVYDFWRCLYSRPFRIYRDFHPKVRSKFCQPDVVDIIPYVDATDEDKKAFVNLVQCFSVRSEDTMCFFHLENLDAYFSGHLYGSYLSFYREVYFTKGVNNELIKGEKPRGCISSRSGRLIARGHKESIYYIDFMTIDRNMTKMDKMFRELFETHTYKIGFMGWKTGNSSNDIRVWLFRRSGVLLDGIVPTVRFLTREYEIPNNPRFYKRDNLAEDVILVDIHRGNIQKMTDVLEAVQGKYSVFGITDETNLVGLIKSGVMNVYVLERRGTILAIYFFRDTRIQFEYETSNTEMKGSILELVASANIACSIDIFRMGFLDAVGSLIKKNSVYRRLRIDNLTDNGMLDCKEWYLVGQEHGAYYLFNLVVPFSSSGSECFILF